MSVLERVVCARACISFRGSSFQQRGFGDLASSQVIQQSLDRKLGSSWWLLWLTDSAFGLRLTHNRAFREDSCALVAAIETMISLYRTLFDLPLFMKQVLSGDLRHVLV